MTESKIRKEGDCAVMTLTPEMLAMLGAKVGDTVYVVAESDGSLRLTTEDPAMADALAAAEIVMDENREVLEALAKL